MLGGSKQISDFAGGRTFHLNQISVCLETLVLTGGEHTVQNSGSFAAPC